MENPVPPPASEPPADPRVVFGQALYGATPRVYFVYLNILLNVAYFAFLCFKGVHWLEPDSRDLMKWGADNTFTTPQGQWWRLVTSAFMHSGIIHLAVNMWSLYNIGTLTERLFGNIHFFVLYMGCAVVSGLASLHFDVGVAVVGASGAIFGLLGALLSYLAFQRKSIPPTIAKSLSTSVLIFAGYNVVMGLSTPGISNSAHIGGLVSGLILGAVMARPLALDRRARQRVPRMIAGLVFIGVMIVVGIRGIPRFEETAAAKLDALHHRFDQEEAKVESDFTALAKDYDAKKIDAGAFADGLEKKVIPKIDEMIRWLTQEAPDDPKSKIIGRHKLLEFASERKIGFTLYAEGFRKGDEQLKARGHDRFNGAVEKLNAAMEAETQSSTQSTQSATQHGK